MKADRSSTQPEDRFIEDFGLLLREYIEPNRLLQLALERLRSVLGVDTATVLRFDARSERLIAVASSGIEEEVHQGVRIPLGSGFAGRVAAALTPIIVDHVDPETVVNPLLWERGLTSLLGVPMVSDGKLIGVLHVGSQTGRRFAESDIRTLERLSERLASSVHFSGLGEDHAAALALQRSLLPAALPAVTGVEVATRYVPGADNGLGGDWYDVFTLPENRAALVMGDVCGRGLTASVVMGRIRSALRAYALEWPLNPAAVLEKVDAKIQHFEPGVMATVIYCVLDLATMEVSISNAGHPPAILATQQGSARFIDVAPDVPIGLFPTIARTVTTVNLSPGDVFALYTDGLIERRGEDIDQGLNRLLESVVTSDPETVCARVMQRLIGPRAPVDDVALLIARRTI